MKKQAMIEFKGGGATRNAAPVSVFSLKILKESTKKN